MWLCCHGVNGEAREQLRGVSFLLPLLGSGKWTQSLDLLHGPLHTEPPCQPLWVHKQSVCRKPPYGSQYLTPSWLQRKRGPLPEPPLVVVLDWRCHCFAQTRQIGAGQHTFPSPHLDPSVPRKCFSSLLRSFLCWEVASSIAPGTQPVLLGKAWAPSELNWNTSWGVQQPKSWVLITMTDLLKSPPRRTSWARCLPFQEASAYCYLCVLWRTLKPRQPKPRVWGPSSPAGAGFLLWASQPSALMPI